MGSRQSLKCCRAGAAESNKDIPTVCGAVLPFDQVLGGEAINQLDGRMMSELELLCEFADRHALPSRKPLDREQSLMLPRSQTGKMGRILAEFQKLSKVIAKCRQHLILGFCEARPTSSGSSRH